MNADAPGRLVWFPAAAQQSASEAAPNEKSGSLIAVRDEDLLARAQTGDSEAVAILFDRFSRLVLSISMRILRDRGEAEDLVQNVFLHLCQKSPSCEANNPKSVLKIAGTEYEQNRTNRVFDSYYHVPAEHRVWLRRDAGCGCSGLVFGLVWANPDNSASRRSNMPGRTSVQHFPVRV